MVQIDLQLLQLFEINVHWWTNASNFALMLPWGLLTNFSLGAHPVSCYRDCLGNLNVIILFDEVT